MKKLVALALCAAVSIPVAATALAAGTPFVPISPGQVEERTYGYDLYVDGKDTGTDACVMVPLRTFAEQLGFSVTWNGDGTVGMDNGVMHSTVTIGKDLYQVVTSVEGMVGMSAPFSLGTAPFVIDGTTYVPLELFEVLLGNREGSVSLENGVVSISASESSESTVQIPNPVTDCNSLDSAEELAGFQVKLPDTVNGSNHRVFRAAEGNFLEVIYLDGETETARVRKAPGSEDVSGIYTEYPDVDTVSVAGTPVTIKGNDEGASLAIWTRGGYSYSVTVESPVSDTEMMEWVAAIQ